MSQRTRRGVSSVSIARTNIDIDDDLVERAMRIYRLASKREAVDYALRRLVGDPMSRERRSPWRAAAGAATSSSRSPGARRDRRVGSAGRRRAVVILVDSSAWIEFLRATGSDVHVAVRDLLTADDELGTTEIVLMEVLAGARSDQERDHLRRLLYGRCTFLALRAPGDYERAAELYRHCRRSGETVRRLTDCLIAVVAMRAGAELLQRDADFDVIARYAPLRLVR